MPCGGFLRPCPICHEVRYCGREGHCLDDQRPDHWVRQRFTIEDVYGKGIVGWTRGETSYSNEQIPSAELAEGKQALAVFWDDLYTFATPPGIRELSHAAQRHPMQVTRAFRQHFGCSIGEYVRRLQLDEARRRVIGSDEPLSTIAHSAGFADQSHMTRLLRRRTGMTPAKLRAAARG